MFMNRYFSPRYPLFLLTANHESLVAAIVALLLISGCGEETIDNPLGGGVDEGGKTEKVISISTPYYPMTLGSRWVYRNPDGSEWTREVTNKEISSHLTYNLVAYNPPIEDSRPGFLKTPAYATTHYRLALLVKRDEIHDAVWQTIRQSGGKHENWNLRHTFDGNAWQTHKNEAALVYLFHYHTSVDSHQEPTPLRFPLVPGQTFKALSMKLSGSNETASAFHSFEASGVITGEVGLPESGETPVGTFEDCLKIQYQGRLESFETMEFNSRLLVPPPPKIQESFLSLLESNIREELADLMLSMAPGLGFETVWLAPGVGPVKIKGAEGTAVLIDYEVKAVDSSQ